MNKELLIRPARPEESRAVEELTREAFMAPGSPGYDYEHYLVHLIRTRPCHVPQLDVVAEAGGQLVGHILYSRAEIATDGGARHPVLTFGPLSVRPGLQCSGVGRALMAHTFAEARRLGYRAVVITGHPDYYPRVGFERGSKYGIAAEDGGSFDALMALPLVDGALVGLAGRFIEDPAFHFDVEEAKVFDQSFDQSHDPARVPLAGILAKLPPAARAGFAAKKVETLSDLVRTSGEEMARWPGMDAAGVPWRRE